MPKQLTKAQLEPVYMAPRSKRDYLSKLKQRLRANGFQDHDRLHQLTDEAAKAIQALSLELHAMVCEGSSYAVTGMTELRKEGTGWCGNYFGDRISVRPEDSAWVARIHGRGPKDGTTEMDATLQGVVGKARRWCEVAMGTRRN